MQHAPPACGLRGRHPPTPGHRRPSTRKRRHRRRNTKTGAPKGQNRARRHIDGESCRPAPSRESGRNRTTRVTAGMGTGTGPCAPNAASMATGSDPRTAWVSGTGANTATAIREKRHLATTRPAPGRQPPGNQAADPDPGKGPPRRRHAHGAERVAPAQQHSQHRPMIRAAMAPPAPAAISPPRGHRRGQACRAHDAPCGAPPQSARGRALRGPRAGPLMAAARERPRRRSAKPEPSQRMAGHQQPRKAPPIVAAAAPTKATITVARLGIDASSATLESSECEFRKARPATAARLRNRPLTRHPSVRSGMARAQRPAGQDRVGAKKPRPSTCSPQQRPALIPPASRVAPMRRRRAASAAPRIGDSDGRRRRELTPRAVSAATVQPASRAPGSARSAAVQEKGRMAAARPPAGAEGAPPWRPDDSPASRQRPPTDSDRRIIGAAPSPRQHAETPPAAGNGPRPPQP